MACNNENNLDMNDELSKVNLSLYEKVIELWRIEEKCRLKLKSIEEINESTTIVNIENDGMEKQLIDVKARMQEVRDNILNIDNITICLYETLAYLEIQYKEKEFSFNKSQSEYELQLFIRMELWQKEEERLNNVPEIKTLKLADLELKNTKLEYENLLKDQDILLENISKAKEENSKKLNDVIVKFATSFIEMLSINKREEQCRVHLRKLDAEFKDKLCMKNSLLESKKHKVNKVSFWYHSPCSLDSNMINMKIDSLNKDSKSSSLYSKNNSQTFSQQHQFDSKHLKLSNEPKPNETFISSSEESSLKINELKSHSEVNLNIAQCSKSLVIDVGEKNIDKNENHGVLDFLTHKRKPIEQQSDFEFKKPYNPFQQEMNRNNNSIMSNVLQSKLTNKNIQMENKLIENQEEDESLNSSVKISQDTLSDNNHTHSSNSVKSAKQSDSMDLTSEEVLKMKLFDDILLQIDESSPYEQNKASSGSYWNNCGVLVSENSRNSSLCGSDLSELFANSYDINQCSDMRLNFMNSLDSDSNTPHESDFQKLKNNVHKQSLEDFMFQPFKNEPFKTTDTKNTKSLNASTSKESNHVTQPTRINFVSTEPFKFNFN